MEDDVNAELGADLPAERVARILGLASLVSGVGLIAAPRALGSLYGLPAHLPLLIRTIGVRDVIVVAGLLASAEQGDDVRPWLRARALSEMVDAALIASLGRGPLRRVKALVALGAGALEAAAARR